MLFLNKNKKFLKSSIKINISDGPSNKHQKYWVGGKYKINLKKINDNIRDNIILRLSNYTKAELFKFDILLKSSGKECLIVDTKKNNLSFCFHIRNTPDLKFNEKNPLKLEVNSIKKLDLVKYDYPERYIQFKSNHPEIIKVFNNGTIIAIRPGNAIITAFGLDKKYVKIKVLSISNNGFLRNYSLNEFNISQYKNIMIVAHPDDETLWGGADLFKQKYFILCITNGYNYARSKDFKEILKLTKNGGIILNYPDAQDSITDDWKEYKNGMLKDIFKILNYKKWNKIITHGPDGTTGHYQHKKTCEFVTNVTKEINQFNKLYYFTKFYKKNETPKYLPRISNNDLKNKVKAVSLYKSVKKNIYRFWFHFLPFEKFILASKWKKSQF